MHSKEFKFKSNFLVKSYNTQSFWEKMKIYQNTEVSGASAHTPPSGRCPHGLPQKKKTLDRTPISFKKLRKA